MHTPDPGEWRDLADELESWGWRDFEVVEMKVGPLDVSYGAASFRLSSTRWANWPAHVG
jgi:hypothetical protein